MLHVHDLAAGLAVLCDGSMARSVRCACQLYRGADGDMGFFEISSFTLSIFKVRLRFEIYGGTAVIGRWGIRDRCITDCASRANAKMDLLSTFPVNIRKSTTYLYLQLVASFVTC